MKILDASHSRPLEGGPSFSVLHRAFRLLWQAAWLCLARWTPPSFRPWRRLVLVAFGAQIAPTANVRSSARVWYPPNLVMADHALLGPGAICYNIAPVRIGRRTIVSQRAHLCTGSHDLSDAHFQLIARQIELDDDVWIAAEAFVGPGVTAHRGSVLGARGAAFQDLEAWTVHRGNPAKAVKERVLRPEPVTGPEGPARLKTGKAQAEAGTF